jgi:hypothetical protein
VHLALGAVDDLYSIQRSVHVLSNRFSKQSALQRMEAEFMLTYFDLSSKLTFEEGT